MTPRLREDTVGTWRRHPAEPQAPILRSYDRDGKVEIDPMI
jgi:hypothetical protein